MYTVPLEAQNHNVPLPFSDQSATHGTSLRWMKNYPARTSKILGTILITCGALAMLTGSVGIPLTLGYGVTFYGALNAFGHGIWCGIFFILGGVFVIDAGVRKYKSFIKTSMVMSIVTSLFAGHLMVLAVIGIVDSANIKENHSGALDFIESRDNLVKGKAVAVAVSSLLLFCALLVLVVSNWSSALACKVVICCKSDSQTSFVRFTKMDTSGDLGFGEIQETEDAPLGSTGMAPSSYNEAFTQGSGNPVCPSYPAEGSDVYANPDS